MNGVGLERYMAHVRQGDMWAYRRLLDKATYGAGHVYLALMVGTPYYKIGMSQNPEQRIYTLTNETLPTDLWSIPPVVLVHAIKTNWRCRLERGMHERYAAKRVRGEWFTLSKEEVDAFCRHKELLHGTMTLAIALLEEYREAYEQYMETYRQRAARMSFSSPIGTRRYTKPNPFAPPIP